MNNFRKLFSFASLVALALFTFSCDNGGGNETPLQTGVIVVNEGNFGSANGSLSFYDEEQSSITNGVVKAANDGNEISATIQTVYTHDGTGYVVCNGADKIEFIDITNYKFLANPLTAVSQPRYMTSVNDKAYISCWGPWDNWTLPDSYVAVMDISSKKVVDTLDCGSGAEGILAVGNKLLVANSYESSVSVIDLSSGTSQKLELEAAPQQFVIDARDSVWVSLTTSYGKFADDKAGVQVIHVNAMKAGSFVQIPSISSKGAIAIDDTGNKVYALTAEAYPGTKTEVMVVDVEHKKRSSTPLISGENFYGLACNVTTGKLYVADANAFAGNGKVLVYDNTGLKLDEQVAGIGPNGFVFK